MMKAEGQFQVKLTPMASFATGSDGVQLGRMSIEKTFTGDIEATSLGEMLSAMTPVQGSAAYVAIEQVTGSVSGKAGTFVLQHNGSMNRGQKSLGLQVVPDSATGELAGLSGTMEIDIRDGKHFYVFDYRLD